MSQPSKDYALTDSISGWRLLVKAEHVYEPQVKFMTQPPLPLWWNEISKKIQELFKLEYNWDTYGAKPVDKKKASFVITKLKSLIDFSAKTPSVVPLTDGGLQFEWHLKDCDIEITFSSEETPAFFFYDTSTDEEIFADLSVESDAELAANLIKTRVPSQA